MTFYITIYLLDPQIIVSKLIYKNLSYFPFKIVGIIAICEHK